MNVDAYDLLSSAVLLLDGESRVAYANAAAEDLFGRSRKQLAGLRAASLFDEDKALRASIEAACSGSLADRRQLAGARRGYDSVQVAVTTVALTDQPWPALMEIREMELRVLAARNQRLLDEVEAQRDLLRNLAHEVKNPLGGLRGAAQLLEAELPDPVLTEYTQVIIAEADRLQGLVDRLLTPRRTPLDLRLLNIHEICERVCALIRAEFRDTVTLVRDYDASMPELRADAERLIQALLNVVRNAAQALTQPGPSEGSAGPRIILRTRVARRVMLAQRQHRLAAVIAVCDNGPGVPEALRERIFHPLVTGRADGTGLGLSLAQNFVQQHGGIIEFESHPGNTEFRLVLPLEPQ